MRRPAALVLLGLWLGMLLASWAMATVNFRTADRVLGPSASPELTARLGGLAAEDRRAVMRHLSSEINRWMFRTWAAAQVVLGAALLALLWGQGGTARVLAGSLLAVSAVQLIGLVPAMRDLGRSLDFLPRPLPGDLAHRFGFLHAAYVGLDLLKALFLSFLTFRLLRRA